MIIIGEKINGAIPAVGRAIAERNDALIADRARRQTEAGAHYIDCAPSTAAADEYDAMVWLAGVIQANTDKPLCLDSPNPRLLARVLEEGLANAPGIVNSVSEEGDKCDVIFPVIAGTPWQVIGLTCDNDGIPRDVARKVEIAKRIIDKADTFGIEPSRVHIDPCVMSLATVPSALEDLVFCIQEIHAIAPGVKVTGALSNISFGMPVRKYVNMNCLAYAVRAGIDSAIMDPCSTDMMGTLYACEALTMKDKGGRKYNRAYRQGLFGQAK